MYVEEKAHTDKWQRSHGQAQQQQQQQAAAAAAAAVSAWLSAATAVGTPHNSSRMFNSL
jgi:hypothetical protein